MQRSGALYTILFSAGVCIVCSAMVSVAAVSLQGRQDFNRVLDKQKKVLDVAGLLEAEEAMSPERIQKLFHENIEPRYVDIETGEYVSEEEVGVSYENYDQQQVARSEELGMRAPSNNARVLRMPRYALVYHMVNEAGEVERIILPIEGYGLWGTLRGYLALEEDTRTIAGITYYEHKETPGLGGEVDNPQWKAEWPGRKAFDDEWDVMIAVKKGQAGPPAEDPYRVDGLSGATITSNGVTNMLQFWLGSNGFGPYLEKFREEYSEAQTA